MSEHGKSMLWFRGREADLILETEDDDDGEGKVLSAYFARSEEDRDFKGVLFSYNEENWQRTTLSESEMKILEDLPCLDETIEFSWSQKDVEMDCVTIKDDALVERLQKIVNDRKNPRIETKGAEMEGKTTLSVKNMSAADIKLESLFDVAVRGETDILVGRWPSADIMFSIENSNVVGGEQVCMRTSLTYDQRGVEEGFFLFRSDGVVLQLDVLAEQLDVLFDAEVTILDDGAQTLKEGDAETNPDVLFYKYAVTNQQGVVEVLNRLLNDSFTLFPRQNNGGTTEKSSGEEKNPRANIGEEFIDLGINTVASAHDQREAALILGPEESISERSDLTEEESKYLLRNWNFDRNLNSVLDRTAREREYLSRHWNFDSNNEGDDYRPSCLNKMQEWFSLLWNYFMNGCDKVAWGQYILGRPPKKPGGVRVLNLPMANWKLCLFFAFMIAPTVCAAEESTVDAGWRDLFFLTLELLPILGLAYQLAEKLWAVIVLVVNFAAAVDSFIDCFEVDMGNASTVHSVLLDCLREDAPLTSFVDPEERVKNFFAKIDADIHELSSKFSCERSKILRVYLKTIFHSNESRNRQGKGLALSRDDHVRIQYSAVRMTAEIISKFETDVQDTKPITNPIMVPAATTVQKSKSSEESNCAYDGTDVLKVETQDEEQVCHEKIVTRGEDKALECMNSRKEDDVTATTVAESLGDPNPWESSCGGKYFPW